MAQNILMSDGKPDPEFRNINPARVDLRVDDGTGVVITTPTVATRVGGAPMTIADSVVDTAAVSGAITITKAGTRVVRWYASEITPVASQTLTFEVYRTLFSGGAAVAVGGKQVFTQTATPVAISGMAGESPIITVGVGDILDLRVIGNTGNVTIKRLQIVSVQQDG